MEYQRMLFLHFIRMICCGLAWEVEFSASIGIISTLPKLSDVWVEGCAGIGEWGGVAGLVAVFAGVSLLGLDEERHNLGT
jgi:hypothetical protein